MKNIHLIPADKARLYLYQGKLYDHKTTMHIADGAQIPQNIYITSDEEIKEGDWFYSVRELIEKAVINYPKGEHFGKIILTTDQDLIKDGVQSIDDEFLEWFVNNPSCEEVDIEEEDYSQKCRECGETVKRGYSCRKGCFMKSGNFICTDKYIRYKIITPKEEQKQHLIDMMRGDEELGLYEEPKQKTTLEETGGIAAGLCQHLEEKEQAMFIAGFIVGAEWQSKRMYSEIHLILDNILYWDTCPDSYKISIKKWLEQFKKK